MKTYTDEYLDRMADLYLDLELARRGVTLEQFLADPRRYLLMDVSAHPLPLLPKQQAVAARLREQERAEHQAEDLPQRNGAQFESLHHHAHPRNNRADFDFNRRLAHER